MLPCDVGRDEFPVSFDAMWASMLSDNSGVRDV